MAANFKGYDISPDMVRLSLVNLYLHGFVEPHIAEYDTLTSEERWNEYADVILANPPFMSPKGGIRPHRRFSVPSKRSEVLFVDYMAEHLTPSGRAGIIVPEGIIFQSQAAHKQLRKMLVENYLVAVVSLPAGVFQPYSGVKTSILILDKGLAKKADRIAFFKVENDGFDLGAQRRAIAENDLPQVAQAVTEYLNMNMDGQDRQDKEKEVPSSCPTCSSMLQHLMAQGTALIVEKERIAADREYNLSGERYREKDHVSDWPIVALGEIAEDIKAGFACGKGAVGTEGVPHIRPMNITETGQFTWSGLKRISDEDYQDRESYALVPGDILFNNTNSKELVGKTCHLYQHIKGGYSNHITRIRVDSSRCVSEFVAYALHAAWQNGKFLSRANKWIGQAGINTKSLGEFQIPLPPLEVQREIVAEIEVYQRVIDGARAVIDNYRPQIAVDPEWPMVRIEELCETGRGRVISKQDLKENPGPYPVYSSQTSDGGTFGHLGTYDFDGEYITWTTDGANAGTVFHRTGKFNCTNVCGTLKCRSDAASFINMRFLAQVLGQVAKSYVVRVGNPKLMNKEVAKIPVPLPPLETQQAIAAELKTEHTLVNANRELIEHFEKKIQVAIDRVWGERSV